jgi:succinate dehydrogenase/fumarate reductase flavoprotein subunit
LRFLFSFHTTEQFPKEVKEMNELTVFGENARLHEAVFDALIIGTGAAGYNAALHLFEQGVTNIALLTENRFAGTSRNTGSDKQTYYKVACVGEDSPRRMAETLFAGGAMDGDLALCEAAHSLQEFFHLVAIGVRFPHNTYGEFVGYKTDHDPLERASSTGPYTSKHMTEQLETEVLRRNIRIIDKTRVVNLLKDKERAYGVVCLERGGSAAGDANSAAFSVYLARNIIFATGGPAGLYHSTVYPRGHFGADGVLARAGVVFANISEWQYGIGSVKFRWNLSGSYQQVIPRYVSVDEDGVEHDFLCPYFSPREKLYSAVFLKGYQWPFDVEKLANQGSSLIDVAIFLEKHVKGRRVYLDFTHNPCCNDAVSDLGAIAKDYLARSNALAPTPVERLTRLNPQAYALYKANGIDLAKDYVEIDVLPQHHNGGTAVNLWWETSVKHLFAIGECAGTHGARRPGGSALNAGQVGGFRAAEYIARYSLKSDVWFDNPAALFQRIREELHTLEQEFAPTNAPPSNAADILDQIQRLNTECINFLRVPPRIRQGLQTLDRLSKPHIDAASFETMFRARETLILSRLFYETILFYALQGGKSRGSALLLDALPNLDALQSGVETDTAFHAQVLNTRYESAGGASGAISVTTRPVHPLPCSETWFERVWRDYSEMT